MGLARHPRDSPSTARVPAVHPSCEWLIAPPQSSARCHGVTDRSSAVSSRTPASFLQVVLPRKSFCHSVAQKDLSFRRAAGGICFSPAANRDTTRNQAVRLRLIMTEVHSADGLSRTAIQAQSATSPTTTTSTPSPRSSRLQPVTLADSARIVQDCGFDLVDLNLAVPLSASSVATEAPGLLPISH